MSVSQTIMIAVIGSDRTHYWPVQRTTYCAISALDSDGPAMENSGPWRRGGYRRIVAVLRIDVEVTIMAVAEAQMPTALTHAYEVSTMNDQLTDGERLLGVGDVVIADRRPNVPHRLHVVQRPGAACRAASGDGQGLATLCCIPGDRGHLLDRALKHVSEVFESTHRHDNSTPTPQLVREGGSHRRCPIMVVGMSLHQGQSDQLISSFSTCGP